MSEFLGDEMPQRQGKLSCHFHDGVGAVIWVVIEKVPFSLSLLVMLFYELIQVI